jgi:spoIIIJ-associated protein
MPREKTFEARTLEEAIASAARFLGIAEEAVHYRLLEEGRLGVMGFGAKPTRIAVDLPDRPAEPVQRPPTPPPPSPAAPAPSPDPPAALTENVQGMLREGGFEMDARFVHDGKGWTVRLEGPDQELFLKRDAELLHAFEFLVHRMGRRTWPEAGPVRIECGGEQGGRDQEVAELAREVAGVVARTGKARRLQPMNPYERRIVHMTVREFPGLVSRSEGEGFLKRITVERGGRRRTRRRR